METVRSQTIENLCQLVGLLTLDFDELVKAKEYMEKDILSFVTIYVPLAHSLITGPLEQQLMKVILKSFMLPSLHIVHKLIESIQGSIDFAD